MVDTTLEAPISPELCLVDPDLAARARLLLEWPQTAVGANGGSVGHGPIRVQSPSRFRHVSLSVAALIAFGAGLALRASEQPRAMSAPGSQSDVTRAAGPSAAPAEQAPVGSAAGGRQRAGAASTPPNAKSQPVPPQSSAPERAATAPAGVAPLVLHWAAAPGAFLYDVILWQGHTRVLDLWPTTTHVTVPQVWTYKGKVFHRLAGTHYLWFVYPVLGSKTAPRSGSLIRTGTF